MNNIRPDFTYIAMTASPEQTNKAKEVIGDLKKLDGLYDSGKTSDDVSVNNQWIHISATLANFNSSGAPMASQPGTFSNASSSSTANASERTDTWKELGDQVNAISNKANSLQEEAMKLMSDPKTAAMGQMKMAQAQAMMAALSNFIQTISKMDETIIRNSAPA